MLAGKLRHRITIQQAAIARDGFGAEVKTWSTFATVWAQIETSSGTETIEQQQAAALRSHTITLRYRSGLKPSMRAQWAGRTFEILAVVDDNLKRETKLSCSEVLANA